MVALGLANTRYKDFYDAWLLSRAWSFERERLAQAIRATFDRRRTPIPVMPPDSLTTVFSADPQKSQQWSVYIADLGSPNLSLVQVVADLAEFLMPHAAYARDIGKVC
jgi:hypothetical protein